MRISFCLSSPKCSKAQLRFDNNFLITSWWLQDDFRMTSGWLQDDFRMTSGWLQDEFRMTSGYYRMSSGWLRMTLGWLLDDFILFIEQTDRQTNQHYKHFLSSRAKKLKAMSLIGHNLLTRIVLTPKIINEDRSQALCLHYFSAWASLEKM